MVGDQCFGKACVVKRKADNWLMEEGGRISRYSEAGRVPQIGRKASSRKWLCGNLRQSCTKIWGHRVAPLRRWTKLPNCRVCVILRWQFFFAAVVALRKVSQRGGHPDPGMECLATFTMVHGSSAMKPSSAGMIVIGSQDARATGLAAGADRGIPCCSPSDQRPTGVLIRRFAAVGESCGLPIAT